MNAATGEVFVKRIKIKSLARGQPVRLTTNEWYKAQQLAETYWLYVVWDPLGVEPTAGPYREPGGAPGPRQARDRGGKVLRDPGGTGRKRIADSTGRSFMNDQSVRSALGSIVRIEALGYRSLRYASCRLRRFHVLVGPNASGKSAFLDVPAFMHDFLRAGLAAAVEGEPRLAVPHRAADAKQLTWMRQGTRFQLALEATIPFKLRNRLKNANTKLCRYETAVDVSGPLQVVTENQWLRPVCPKRSNLTPAQKTLFPLPPAPPGSIVQAFRKRSPAGWKKIVGRGDEPERVTYWSETSGWNNPFRVAANRAALANLPEDEERFPVATWFRKLLTDGVQRLALSSEAMRLPSPPGRARGFLPDGSNLPWVVHTLEREHSGRLQD